MNAKPFEEIESEVRAYCRTWPTVFERAGGSYVYDEAGRPFLDFFTGVATLSYGHRVGSVRRPPGPSRPRTVWQASSPATTRND